MMKVNTCGIAILRSGINGREIKIVSGTTAINMVASIYKHKTGKNYYSILEEVLPITREEEKFLINSIKTEMVALGFEKTSRNTFKTMNLTKADLKELISMIYLDTLKNI